MIDAPLFDHYVVVDWSAASRPVTGANSIWIADRQGDRPAEPANPPTRADAERHLREILAGATADRVLLAIDVSLGYPVGTSSQLGLAGTPWRAMWRELADLIDDGDDNHNNRFAAAAALNERWVGPGPFWGCPAGQARAALATTRPVDTGTPEFRHTEARLRESGWRPKSGWQLAYTGSVGSQSLTAIPVLERLRADLGERLVVWPFGGVVPPVTAPGSVVVAEVYPSMYEVEVPPGWVLDAAQVVGVARELVAADRRGELAGWFAPELSAAQRAAVESEEGWVLGPPTARPVR